jgi:hypothetical protein
MIATGGLLRRFPAASREEAFRKKPSTRFSPPPPTTAHARKTGDQLAPRQVPEVED